MPSLNSASACHPLLYETINGCMIGRIMKRTHGAGVALLLVVAALAGGCSSSQMNRIDQNRHIYEQWPLETRQAVLDGKVEVGMTQDQVFVSWGKPTEVVTHASSGDEIWIFKRGGNEGSVYYPGGGMGGSTGGPGIGISTSNRGGTSVGATGGIGIGGSMGGVSGGVGGMGGSNGAIVTPPTPPDVREIVFRNGVVFKADRPWDK